MMVQVNVTLTQTIKKLLDEKKFATLRDILITMMPYDIAAVFEELQDEKMPILFRLLPKELAAETFVEMDEDTQEFLIHGFSDSELKEVVDELFLDDAVDLIEEMPANVVKRILRTADKDMRKQINELLKYPEDSAGSIMTTEFISLRPDMTAEMAIKRIRRTGVDKETIYTCYVNDENNKLIGITTVKDLLLANDDDAVRDLMEEHVISVRGQRTAHRGYRHDRRRDRRYPGGGDRGYRKDGGGLALRQALYENRRVRHLPQARAVALGAHAVRHLHQHDHLVL